MKGAYQMVSDDGQGSRRRDCPIRAQRALRGELIYRRGMALASTRPAPSARTAAALLLATLALAGCSEGDNDDNGKLTAAVTVTPDF